MSQQSKNRESDIGSTAATQNLAKKNQKINVLTGAVSTSYQLPVIWAG